MSDNARASAVRRHGSRAIVVVGLLVPCTGPSQTTLMGRSVNNGSFEIIEPHTAPITNAVGRRAAITGTFLVGGTSLQPGVWQFTPIASFGGVDTTSAAGGAHDGSEVMVSRFAGAVLTAESGAIPATVSPGDVFNLSAWTMSDYPGAEFVYSLGLRFDGGVTVPVLEGTHRSVSPIVWISRVGDPYVSTMTATSVQVVATISNIVGTITDRACLDDITLEHDTLESGRVVITAHPQDATRRLGEPHAVSLFSVDAVTKSATLTYQWRQDGTLLVGETNQVLALTNAPIAQYDVVVTSSLSLSATSRTATVIETLPPLNEGDQSVSEGDPATLSIAMETGSPYTYQWYRNGTPIGANQATHLIAAATPADQGFYRVEVTYYDRSLLSEAAGLAVAPAGVRYLMAPTYHNGSFELIDPHTAPIFDTNGLRMSDYGVRFVVANWTFMPVNGLFGVASTLITNTLPRSSQEGDIAAFAHTYTSGTLLSDPIPVDPADGSRFQLSLHSGGDGTTDLDVAAKLLFDAQPAVTVLEFTETSEQDWREHAGIYHLASPATSVRVQLDLDNSRGVGARSYVDNLVLEQSTRTGQVRIEQQPEDLTLLESRLAEFDVVVSGDGTIAMQWMRDGVPLPGATHATLQFIATRADDQAVYQLFASNTVLSTTYTTSSVPVKLTVLTDLVSPAALEATYLPTNRIAVTFSEAVSTVTATNLDNYTLTGPTGSVAILDAVLEPAGDIVVLRTALLTRGGSFTLHIQDVEDLASSANVIAPGTELHFSVPAIPDPLLYLPFDETAGSVAHDHSGNGLDGQLRFNAEFAPGKINHGVLLHGGTSFAEGDMVLVPDHPQLDFNGKSFTIAFYTRDVADWGFSVAKGQGAGRGWGIIEGLFRLGDGAHDPGYFPFGATGGGLWIHLAVTVDAAARRLMLYRDGHRVGQWDLPAEFDLNNINTVAPFLVGARGSGHEPFFSGMIDEVYLWDAVLTEAQIRFLVDDTPPTGSTAVEYVATDEEFVGPFPSWRNIRTDYGAVGDGIADDTAAIQAAFHDLRGIYTNDYSVLYFPAGTYRITSTITTTNRTEHEDYLGPSVIGEHPTNTVFVWDGPAGGDMIHFDSWYAKISRFTFEGRNLASSGLRKGGQFSTYCEVSDIHFVDLRYGILLGPPHGQAEHVVQRCRFTRCWDAGICTADWNSLDLWVWDCLFEDCYRGCYNEMGNYHVWRSVFLRSKGVDLRTENLSFFSAVGNTSIGSGAFIDWTGPFTQGSPMLIQDNDVYDVAGDRAIALGNTGPFSLIDNRIKNRPGDTNAAVALSGGANLLVGNTYTVPDPVIAQGRYRIVDQQVVDPSTMPTPATVQLPRTPPNRVRAIFEVHPGTGDDAAEIQARINDAAAQPYGSRPVVHIPHGFYSIDRTLVVPPLRDIQIMGDGGLQATRLHWTAATTGLVLRLEGPSRARVMDLALMGGANAGCLEITEADQDGGRIHGSQVNCGGWHPEDFAGNEFFVDGVESSDVTLLSGGYGTFCDNAVHVRGGARQRQGLDTPGQVSIFGGASGTPETAYRVTHGGRLVEQSVYHEIDGYGYDVQNIVTLRHKGSLTIANTLMNFTAETNVPNYRVDGHQGRFTLLACLMNHAGGGSPSQWFDLTGDGGTMQVSVLANDVTVNGLQPGGNYVDSPYIFRDETSPPGGNTFLLCNAKPRSAAYSPQGNSYSYALQPIAGQVPGAEPSDQAIRDALVDLRAARRELPTERPAGVTDVKLHRIIAACGGGHTVLHIRGTPVPYTLTVVSAHGGAWPGTMTTNEGTTVECLVTNSPVEAAPGATRYVCVGGIVASNDYTLVSPTNIVLALTNDAVLTWHWETNHWLQTEADGPGTVSPTPAWVPAGTNLQATATPDSYYHFTGWTGSLSTSTNPLPVTVDMPYTLVAGFAANTVANGVPEWWLAQYGWTNDFLAAALADPDGDGRITADEWTADTVPDDAASRLEATVSTDGPGTTVHWQGGVLATQYLEYAPDLATPDELWQILFTNMPPTTVVSNYTHEVSGAQRLYYRIRAERP